MDSDARVLSPWQTLERQTLLSAPPWLEILREKVRLPGGKVLDDFYHITLPEFVMVVARTASGEFLMVRGYKHGLGGINLSPPAGLIEPGEPPADAARRELLEETGHEAADWQALGRFVVDGNRGCGRMHLFSARGVRKVRTPQDDPAEELNVEVLAKADVLRALAAGEIGNLAGAGGLALALALNP